MEQPKQNDKDGRLREIEQGLIDRIADVDDDRRRTATAMQRALDTRVEEMDAKLRRSRRMTAAFAAVAILLALVALWFGIRLPAIGSAELEEELARVKQDVARMTVVGAEDTMLREKLTGLAEMVSDISASLEMLELERAERQKADAGLAKRLERSEMLQERMASDIDALRTALAEVSSTPETASGRDPEGFPHPPAQPEPANLQQPPLPAEAAEEFASGRSSAQMAAGLTLREVQADVSGHEDSMPVERESPSDAEKDTEEPPADSSPQAELATAAPAVEPEPIEDTGTPIAAKMEESGRNTARAPSVHESNLILDDRHFALQLIGFYSLDALREFADRDDIPSRLYYRRESLRGRPWYVLIHSLHADVASTAAARSALPPDLAALDTWIRPLGKGTQLEVFEFAANTP